MKTLDLSLISDEMVHALTEKIPTAELHELGAIFISIGCYLTATAIPDLWPQLKPAAVLAHQLLNQKLIEKEERRIIT
jgi:hypothetical protein